MKILRSLALLVGISAITVPLISLAQTNNPPPQSGTVTGNSSDTQTPPGNPGQPGQPDHRQFGMRKLMQGITLTDQQQQQIGQILDQFRQTHQPGAPHDPQGMQNLRTAVENALTPDQRTQFENNVAQMRANHRQNANSGGSGGQGNPNGNVNPGGPFIPDSTPPPSNPT